MNFGCFVFFFGNHIYSFIHQMCFLSIFIDTHHTGVVSKHTTRFGHIKIILLVLNEKIEIQWRILFPMKKERLKSLTQYFFSFL